ncbi:EF-P 5-aminopentanol modification-associated protein YfmH [Salisediminibacterium halotolerans]|uniref:Predicted Zn-dependent peptidase n=1 Tax=Salisediminibacterium halotolerans TaxID=517425 RepID=A0A1H9QA66_9BACI|nr:pitrilysin family protein [Salisediminibacterium haloalkalitolerans]SER57302.1 Predicted Zn-dependent peptidase [Salisediminibacterium haloalkalitolerans]
MKAVEFQQINETLYTETLPNGLTVYLLPKNGFQKTFATFTTKYGSIDRTFQPLNSTETITVPDGIAHFLEHKMFEDEEGDVFHTFSKQGASANAFTSFTNTAYLFSSTTNVSENVQTLLDFVQKPYFTDETVEKEKGIIGQEINMYDDNPDWRNFFGLLNGMYENHPVAVDIAGTVESINEISKDDLYTCYETFYHPSNMVLFIVGAVDPDSLIEEIRTNQQEKIFPPAPAIQRQEDFAEPEKVKQRSVEISMPVQTPKCLIGVKEASPVLSGKDLLQYELAVELILEIAFGESSPRYQELFEEGLIDDSFEFDVEYERGFAFSVFGGESPRPYELAERLKQIALAVRPEITQSELNRMKKKKIGEFLKSLNSPEFIATQFTRYRFNDAELFDVIPILEDLNLEDVQRVYDEHFRSEEQMTACIVINKEEENGG